jgi:hydrogenase expression/formation protein HypC
MCLAIPMKVVEINGEMGIVESGDIRKKVVLSLIDPVKIDDYVIVHAGFAIQLLNEEEAQKTLDLFRDMIEMIDREEQ